MTRLIVDAQASQDLLEIWRYIADRGRPEAASRLIATIQAGCETIRERPNVGRPLEGVGDDRVLFYRAEKYLIGYRIKSDAIIIDRVIHGARQVARVYRSGER